MLRQTKVKNGELRGLPGNDPRITVYKGIPFAAPPVGENRWRAPQPCEDWEGVRNAFEFGPISVQDQPAVGTDIYCREWHVDPDIPMNEDCLYLNVWTPAKSKDEKLPVLLWIFGGGFQWGYTAEMEFNGEALASRGIIVVSVNYRLAALGFMCHPEITSESPDYPANFGLLDQQAGLRWVRENIGVFGGDPDNITIAGQSAGGASVLNQITNAENFNFIKGAAVWSGMIRFPGEGDAILKPLALPEAERLGEKFFEFLGVKSLSEARALDAFYIRDKYGEWAQSNPRVAAIFDGIHYIDDPLDRYENNKMADIPVITGYTSDEFEINGKYIVKESTLDSVSLNNGQAGREGRNFVYEFSTDVPGWDDPGNFHSFDLWFWFGTLEKCWRPLRGRHYDLSRQMVGYLSNFVKTHDPNGKDDDGSDLPLWKPMSNMTSSKDIMRFTSDGAVPSQINR